MNVYYYRDKYISEHGLDPTMPLTTEQYYAIRETFERAESRIFWRQCDIAALLVIAVAAVPATRPLAAPLAALVLLLGFRAWISLVERIYL